MRTFQKIVARSLVFLLGLLGTVVNLRAQSDLAPVITAQPQPQTSFEGADLYLRVSATPATGLRYRWRFFGTNLPNDFPGQSTPYLTLRNITKNFEGPYSVIVSNAYGAVTSQVALITVNRAGDILAEGVGYINLIAEKGYSLFSVQLAQAGPYQTVDQQIFGRDGVSIFKVDGAGFTANNFLGDWSKPNQVLVIGESFFFHNPSDEPTTITIVGNVLVGQMISRMPAGLSLATSIVPQSAPLSSLGFPATSGAQVYLYDQQSETYSLYTFDQDQWFPAEPSPRVGQPIFVREPSAIDWIRTFYVDFASAWVPYLIVEPRLESEIVEINFFTYHPDPAFGRVLDLDGITPLNASFVGQLYAGTNAVETSLAPIGQPLSFQDNSGGCIRGETVKLPGSRGGDKVWMQLRVWEKCAGSTFEQAVGNGSAWGRSELFQTTLHSPVEGGGPGLPPRNANSFLSFKVALGEPSILRVAAVQPATNGVEVCFATQPGWVYNLQKCASWDNEVIWTTVPGAEEVIGTGHIARITDSSTRQCFYRLRRVR